MADLRAIGSLLLTAALTVAGCSSSGNQPADLPTSAPNAPTTNATVAPTTTATKPSTTLAPEAQAEAEITAVVESWYEFPFDTSKGEAGLGLEFTTGAVRERTLEVARQREEEGTIQRNRGGTRIRIVEISELDLSAGTAQVEACGIGDEELVNATTGEVLVADAAATGSESVVYLTRTDDGWKVSEFFSTQGQGDPVPCDVGGS